MHVNDRYGIVIETMFPLRSFLGIERFFKTLKNYVLFILSRLSKYDFENREYLAAKVYFDGILVSVLYKLDDSVKIEIPHRNENISNCRPKMYLDEFLECIELAREMLEDARRH